LAALLLAAALALTLALALALTLALALALILADVALLLAAALALTAAIGKLVLRIGGKRLDAPAHLVAQVAIAEQRAAGGDAAAELGIAQRSGGTAIVQEAHGIARGGLVALGRRLLLVGLLRLLLLLLTVELRLRLALRLLFLLALLLLLLLLL